MKRLLDLRIQVDLYHEPVNHSPLPWAGISYSLSMNPLASLCALLRKNWLVRVESATLEAVVSYYRRGVVRPTSVRLLIPYDGKAKILGITSQGPQTPSFWRRTRRLTPSGRRHDMFPVKSRIHAKNLRTSLRSAKLKESASCSNTGRQM